MLISEFEDKCFLVRPASHTYVHYRMTEKKKLAKLAAWKKWILRRNQFSSVMNNRGVNDVPGGAFKVYATILTSSRRFTTCETR